MSLSTMLRLAAVLVLTGALAVSVRPTRSHTAFAGTSDNRPIIVYRPAGLSQAKPVPLVIVLHGYNGAPWVMPTLTGFNTVADQNGFVVAYLKSATIGWHSTGWGPQDDVDYISSMIDQLTKAQNIDRNRVYIAGSSSGGFMAFRIGCDLAAKVAAIGSVNGNMASTDTCSPARPISVIALFGSSDTPNMNGVALRASAPATMKRWHDLGHCPASPQTSQTGVLHQQVWAPCAGGTAVDFAVVQGGTHTWFGQPGLDPSSPDSQVNATQLLWTFFAAHPAPQSTRVSAQILSARVRTAGATRQILVRARVDQAVTAKLSLLARGRAVATRTLSVRKAGAANLVWPLPRRTAAGRYTLRIVFANAAGSQLVLSRTLRVPS